MIRAKVVVVLTATLAAGACETDRTEYLQAPPPAVVAVAPSGAELVCRDEGFTPGTIAYDRCLSNQAAVRRYGYREQTVVYVPATPPPAQVYPTPPYPAAPYVETRTATTGIPAFQDEYGFRYDAEGNRLDRYGNIISPHTRTP
jgi:hypothetical protein